MCGRFTLTRPDRLLDEGVGIEGMGDLGELALPGEIRPRYNIAPSQLVWVLPNTEPYGLALFRWGLIPHWASDETAGHRMINARAETLASKPAFRRSLQRKRCLVLADGFYEWQALGGHKVPYFICRRDRRPFALAGLCTIVTTEPSPLLAAIHERMPVILRPEHVVPWIAPTPRDADQLAPLLAPLDEELLEAYPVSKRVNTPAFDDPACIERADDPRPRQTSLFD
jgi:putative SOS response-associated peptidase YedK